LDIGSLVFLAALLRTKGNDENTAELANLKGTMDAIEQVSIKKNCAIVPTSPTGAARRVK
jgi:hypothetical protein